VEFFLNQEVVSIEKKENHYLVHTGNSQYETKTIVNAAGVYADVIHNMVSEKKMKNIPRKGEYCLMDKKAGNFVSHTIFQMPAKYGKGVLVTPTVHGNLMAGPTAVDILDKEGINTTADR
jgi:glycerol-3-phosphate dehydrogenase